ncbi:MAG: hypothetical protein CM15mP126_1130 [Gammaproteobacteria bacterium]|nr:MAG: hypothetical protein CM15mP126_1130 [Gammaproteobacteria bacterium]
MGIDAYGSCTPAGIVRLIEHYKIDVEGLNAAVVGRSPILGKPMAMMLLNLNATVTICHSRTKDLEDIIKRLILLWELLEFQNLFKLIGLKKMLLL